MSSGDARHGVLQNLKHIRVVGSLIQLGVDINAQYSICGKPGVCIFDSFCLFFSGGGGGQCKPKGLRGTREGLTPMTNRALSTLP